MSFDNNNKQQVELLEQEQEQLTFSQFNRKKYFSGLQQDISLDQIVKAQQKINDIEDKYYFNTGDYGYPKIVDPYMYYYSRPMVTFAGQFSTGKTSAIKHLTGFNYLGMHIGAAKATDCFNFLYDVSNDKVKEVSFSGRQVLNFKHIPLIGLQSTFTSKINYMLQSHFINSHGKNRFKDLIVVDSPGIVSNFSDKSSEHDDFLKFWKILIRQSDLIVTLLDKNSVDFTPDLKRLFKTMFQEEKGKVIFALNKVDSLSSQELVDINGNINFEFGKLQNKNEVQKIYKCSLSGKSPLSDPNAQEDQKNLINYIESLPERVVYTRQNSFIQRMLMLEQHLRHLKELQDRKPTWIKRIFSDNQNIHNKIFSEERVYNLLSNREYKSYFDIEAFQTILKNSIGRHTIPNVQQKDIDRVVKIQKDVFQDIDEPRKKFLGIF